MNNLENLSIDWNHSVELEEQEYTQAFTYDAQGNVLTQTAPDGSVTTNTYNQAGLLESVTVQFAEKNTQNIIEHIHYDAKGQRTQVDYGNGVKTTYHYEPTTLRLEQVLSTRVHGGKTETCQDMRYWYDPVGNITRLWNASAEGVFHANQSVQPVADYTYDAMYRLIKATGRQHLGLSGHDLQQAELPDELKQIFTFNTNDATKLEAYTEEYIYDDGNNLIKKTHQAHSSTWTVDLPAAADSNRLLHFSYDAAGNMLRLTEDGTTQLRYNCCNNLVRATVVERPEGIDDAEFYWYDSNEQRTRKLTQTVANGGAVRHWEEKVYVGNYEVKRVMQVDADGQVRQVLERQTLRVMDGDSCVAICHHWVQDDKAVEAQMGTRQVRFQLLTHQESVAVEVDTAGKLITYQEYLPYGGTSLMAGSSVLEVKLKEYQYGGKERDGVTGLYYYGMRYYAPWLGRWEKGDPVRQGDSINAYCFLKLNVIRGIDIYGLMQSKPQSEDFSGYSTNPPLTYSAQNSLFFELGASILTELTSLADSDLDNLKKNLNVLNDRLDSIKLATSKSDDYEKTGDVISSLFTEEIEKKQFGKEYRNVESATDEIFSTASVTHLIMGASEVSNTNTEKAKSALIEGLKIVSWFRLPTKYTATRLSDENNQTLQHPTSTEHKFVSTNNVNHGNWDRSRRDHALSYGASSNGFSGINRLFAVLKGAVEYTLNTIMPFLANNASLPSSIKQSDKEEQTKLREVLKQGFSVISEFIGAPLNKTTIYQAKNNPFTLCATVGMGKQRSISPQRI